MTSVSALRSPDIAEDPRIVRTRQSVMDATIDLLIEGGAPAVTIDAIVSRSKVAKSTIYRHWKTRDDVLVSVMEACSPELPEPDDATPVAEALREVLYAVVEMTGDPMTARVMSTMILMRLDLEGLAALEKHLEKKQTDTLEKLLSRGVAEGVIRPGYDPEQAAAHLIGPMIFAFLTGSLPCDQALADQTIEVFLAAYGTGAARTATAAP